MPREVFISHAHQDRLAAEAVCHLLESESIGCWLAPRDVPPGEEYSSAIINALAEARLLVLVFSSAANQSGFVLREVERAASKGMAILPLRVESVSPSARFELFLSLPHWLDAYPPPLQQHFPALVAAVRAQLNSPAASQTLPVQNVPPRRGFAPKGQLLFGASALLLILAVSVYIAATRSGLSNAGAREHRESTGQKSPLEMALAAAFGIGQPLALQKAQAYFESALAAGDSRAIVLRHLPEGFPSEPQKVGESAVLNWRSSAAAGDSISMLTIGFWLLQTSEPTQQAEGARWLLQAASGGQPVAALLIGRCLQSGLRGVPQDNAQAALHLRFAADNGLPLAHVALALLLKTGWETVQPNPKAALDHLEKAAQAGNAEGQWRLAETLRETNGESPPSETALGRAERLASALLLREPELCESLRQNPEQVRWP